MGYQRVPYQGFGNGLNLTAQPDVIKQAEAIDLLNVTFTDVGAVKQRPGYDLLTDAPGAMRYDSLNPFYKLDGTKQLLAGASSGVTGRVDVLNALGALQYSLTGLSAGPFAFARFGSPGLETVYFGNGTDTIRRFDGAAFTAPANMPKGNFLAITGWDNRLVTAGFKTTTGGPAGVTSSPSHVWFSNPGAPETWGANSYDQLRPGDGEKIMGVVAWREFVFVFKETAFWRFHATTSDSVGNPVFHKLAVQAGIGAVSPRAIVAARDGVYFMGRNGIYRTQGNEPTLISNLIDPMFIGGLSPHFQGEPLNHGALSQATMAMFKERLYVGIPTGGSPTNDRTLVHDPRYGWWSLYDFPASAMAAMRTSALEELVFALASGANHIGCHSDAYTTDNGVPINSRWRGGWFDVNNPDVKILPQWKLWGTGNLKSGMAYDYRAPENAQTVIFHGIRDQWSTDVSDVWTADASDTWTTGTPLDSELVRHAVRGTVFSLGFESDNGAPWEVHRATILLRAPSRPPSIVTANP